MVTDRICLDGKRHNWNFITMQHEYGHKRKFEHCKKCGSITEFVDGKRCLDQDDKNKYYIEIPECHK